MVSAIRRSSVLGVALLSAIMVLSGCATRKYVRLQTQALEPAIQEAQNGVKENAERIDAVDRRAQQGVTAAAAADTKAVAAQQAAQTAQTAAQAADRKADTANQGVQTANNRINTVDARIDSLDTYTAGEAQMVLFRINSDVLGDEAKQSLDIVASSVLAQKGGYLIEIQGFTDSTGTEKYNAILSERRAGTALHYLVSKGVPLHRLSVIGLGEERPIADNSVAEGREQNRRVEVRVLQSAAARRSRRNADTVSRTPCGRARFSSRRCRGSGGMRQA